MIFFTIKSTPNFSTLKPGFGASLTGNLNFKRQLFVDNL